MSGASHIKNRSTRKDHAYNKLVDLLPGILFEADLETNITFTDKSGLATFGYNEADLENGLSCLNMVIPEDRPRVAASFERTTGGTDFASEYTALRKDGTTFPMLAYISPVNSGEKVIRFLGLVVDISKFKQVQEDLAQSEEKYRLVVENASEGLLVTGQGKFRFANPKACELLGYGPEEIHGMDYLQFVHADDLEVAIKAQQQRREIRPGGPHHKFTCRVFNKYGKEVWLELNGVPIVWDGRDSWLNFVIDVTQQRMAQDDALLRAKLQAAIETAGATCHEMNQPLQAVVLMTDLMMTQMDRDDPLLPRMEKMRQQVRRMADITHRLNRITSYKVKDYIGLGNILDLESVGPERDLDDDEDESQKTG